MINRKPPSTAFVALFIALFAWQASAVAVDIPRARGLAARSVEELSKLPESETDLGTAILVISKSVSEDLYGQTFDIEAHRKVIDDIASKIRVRRGAPVTDVIRAINQAIYRDGGFTTPRVPRGIAKEALLNYVLADRKGMCLGLSMLYMAVAERVGLPLYGVLVPGHIFLQYQDSETALDIESTAQGFTANEQYFVQMLSARGKGLYCMRKYRKREIIGIYLKDMAIYYVDAKKPEKAIQALESSLMMNAGDYEVHAMLGGLYIEQGRTSDAIDTLWNAVEMNSSLSWAREALAYAYLREKNFKDAVATYEEAAEEGQLSEASLANLRVARKMLGDKELKIPRVTGEGFDNPDEWNKGLAEIQAPPKVQLGRR